MQPAVSEAYLRKVGVPFPRRSQRYKQELTTESQDLKLTCYRNRLCFWCLRKFHKLTRDHLKPRSFGGGSYNNLVPACRPCNHSRGILVSAYIETFRASRATPDVLHKAVQKLAELKSLFNWWVELELERLGWSPTQDLGTPRCPFPESLIRRVEKTDEQKANAKMHRLEIGRWVDDGGR